MNISGAPYYANSRPQKSIQTLLVDTMPSTNYGNVYIPDSISVAVSQIINPSPSSSILYPSPRFQFVSPLYTFQGGPVPGYSNECGYCATFANITGKLIPIMTK